MMKGELNLFKGHALKKSPGVHFCQQNKQNEHITGFESSSSQPKTNQTKSN
jgi:hypothetical protein